MTISIRATEVSQSTENASEYQDDSQTYDLIRAEQVLTSNEVAKFEIASELCRQGLTVDSISRIIGISQEEIIAEFES